MDSPIFEEGQVYLLYQGVFYTLKFYIYTVCSNFYICKYGQSEDICSLKTECLKRLTIEFFSPARVIIILGKKTIVFYIVTKAAYAFIVIHVYSIKLGEIKENMSQY